MRKTFADSVKELKNVKSLAAAGMLLALAVVLGIFSIQLTESVKISFAFLADQLAGLLFGPFVGGLVGGAADILKYFIRPTGPYFPGFTISEILTGVIYGFAYYKKPAGLLRIASANILTAAVVNIILNTLWLTLLYGSAFFAILPARIIKQFITVPVNIALFYLLVKLLQRAKIIQFGL